MIELLLKVKIWITEGLEESLRADSQRPRRWE